MVYVTIASYLASGCASYHSIMFDVEFAVTIVISGKPPR